MATIEPYVLADGKTKRYRVRYRTPDKRSTDKGGFARVKDAKDFAATVEVSMMRGEYVAPADARATIGQLGPRWLGRQTHLKPSAASGGDRLASARCAAVVGGGRQRRPAHRRAAVGVRPERETWCDDGYPGVRSARRDPG